MNQRMQLTNKTYHLLVVFQGPLFDIMCTRVQSDPFAGPSTFSVYIHPEQTLYPPELYLNSIR